MSTAQILSTLPRMGTALAGSTVVVSGLVAGTPCVRLADGRRIVGESVYFLPTTRQDIPCSHVGH